jgi:ABC-type transport system substrate-binding protein
VVEARGGDLRTYAVGTGPFKLREWKRGNRLVLDVNPGYRGVPFPQTAAAELTRADAGTARSRASRRIELMIIEEDATRLLEFDRGNIDLMVVRSDIATRLVDADHLKPSTPRAAFHGSRVPEPYLTSLYFNLRDATVGGMDTPHVALRRAVWRSRWTSTSW